MFSKDQERKAEQCSVRKVGESAKALYFKVVLVDSEGEHEHQVSFNKITKKLSCDCTWCSYYGLRPKSRSKKCYNILAVINRVKAGKC